MSSTIDAAALTKRYGQTTAVDALSLSIPAGTVYGFLGPNGAGKTTTMRMLTGLTRPTSGTVRINGIEANNRTAIRSQFGYLPEEPPLYDELTGFEQLDYIAGLRDLDPETARARADDLLSRLDLAADAGEPIGEYSKGMRQKLAFVQAVLHDPPVLLLDEPTSGLDPRAARTLRELITAYADEGTTIFLSTHILPVVEELADTIGVLADGKLVAEGAPETLTRRAETGEERTLEEAFLEVTDELRPEDGATDA
ncbi:ABC transporter ATP-binding protein [Haladaptatus sp. GCM10025707]|uniref:ABC transporter ATP-binding protein n=1 Tax=unclassified Haladaptatus TaxID=2622732 RepID=UPI0023E7D856|nr:MULTISPECIES: ABC transporter ATP-binding protein [unclassified Haladaptatus]